MAVVEPPFRLIILGWSKREMGGVGLTEMVGLNFLVSHLHSFVQSSSEVSVSRQIIWNVLYLNRLQVNHLFELFPFNKVRHNVTNS